MGFVRQPFRLHLGTVVGTLLVTACLCLGSWALSLSSASPSPDRSPTMGFSAALTLIPAPTSTSTPTATPFLTPTASAAANGQGIAIGAYVQISGTEGQGLRLRAAPGLSAPLLFLGYDAEVYQVRDGPRQADGYTWWYLVAPYDEGRAGWAAGDFLTLVAPPSQ